MTTLLRHWPLGRVIERLRKEFPTEQWVYVEGGGPMGPCWCTVSGSRRVVAVSQLAPAFDGDDDTFETRYIDRVTNTWVLE